MEDEALKAPAPKRVFRKPEKKQIIIILAAVVIGAVCSWLTGDISLTVFAMGAAVLWALVKGALAGKVIISLVALYIFLGTPPLTMHSSALWRYPIQRAYIGLYQNIKEPEWFPDFERDVKGGYEFDYMPSVMQGTGHYSVYFETDEETIERYTQEFSSKAVYSFTFAEYSVAERSAYAPADSDEKREDSIGDISMFLGGRYSDCTSAGVQVYVLETNMDFNHPHTSAVFIDKDNNAVFLSRLG